VALAREEFDALLYTACGVTGAMSWEGREVKLRAHPSSGALYAVEIYPVVFRVQGLEPAVYHYGAVDNVLEAVRRGIDPSSIVRAALPVERDMVAGAAALICLVGAFRRHDASMEKAAIDAGGRSRAHLPEPDPGKRLRWV